MNNVDDFPDDDYRSQVLFETPWYRPDTGRDLGECPRCHSRDVKMQWIIYAEGEAEQLDRFDTFAERRYFCNECTNLYGEREKQGVPYDD